MLVRRLCATPALLIAKNYVATLNVPHSQATDTTQAWGAVPKRRHLIRPVATECGERRRVEQQEFRNRSSHVGLGGMNLTACVICEPCGLWMVVIDVTICT